MKEKKENIINEIRYINIKNKNIINLSIELSKLLTKNFNEIFTSDIFNKLSKIAFLPCKIPSIKSNKNKNNNNNNNYDNITICCPYECILEKDYYLSWTISPVIIIKMPEMGLKHLKILTAPSIDNV